MEITLGARRENAEVHITREDNGFTVQAGPGLDDFGDRRPDTVRRVYESLDGVLGLLNYLSESEGD